MPDFNDLQVLKKLANHLQWWAIGLAFLVVIFQLGKWMLDRRIENVKDGFEKKSQEKLDKLNSTVQLNKLTIRDFETTLKVKFNGKWSSNPYPITIMSPVSEYYYLEFQSADNNSPIKLYATQAYQFNTLSKNSAEFISRQAVRKDDFPLGRPINAIESYDKITIHIPFIMHKEIIDSKIIIEYVEIAFIINGEKRYVLNQHCSFEVPIIIHGNQGYANPCILLSQNALVEWLKPNQQ